MSTKRILSLVLALVMVLGTFGTVFAAPTASDKLEFLMDNGILKEGKLDQDLKRRDSVVLLSRLFDVEEEAKAHEATDKYDDIDDAFYNGYIGWATEKEYVNGKENGKFDPNGPLTAQQFSTMLLRALGYQENGKNIFDKAYAEAKELGILEDVDVEEKETVTRADMAAMTYNALSVVVKGTSKTLAETLGIEMPAPEVLEVEDVYADNLKEIKVKLNNPKLVNVDEVEDARNYRTDAGTVVEAKLDGNFVVLTLQGSMAQNRKYELTTRYIKGIDLDKKVFTAYDNQAPAVEKVTVLGTKGIRVRMTEPVTGAQEKNFLLDGKNFVMRVEHYGRDILLLPYREDGTFAEGTYELTVGSLTDYAGFKSRAEEHEIEIVEDKTKPEVVKVIARNTSVIVEFANEVHPDSVSKKNVSWTEVRGRKATEADDFEILAGNKIEYKFGTAKELPKPAATIRISGLENYSGYAMDAYEAIHTIEVDFSRPEIVNFKFTAKNEMEIEFNKALEVASAEDEDNYSLYEYKVADKEYKVTKYAVKEAKLDGRFVTVEFEDGTLTEGNKYRLNVEGVRDNTTLRNTMISDELEFTYGIGESLKVVAVKERTTEKIVLEFNKDLVRREAEDLRNYEFELSGETSHFRASDLSKNPSVYLYGDGKTVEINLPGNGRTISFVHLGTGLTALDGNRVSVVERIVDLSRNYLSATKATLSKDGLKLTVQFNQKLVDQAIDHTAITVNTATVSSATVNKDRNLEITLASAVDNVTFIDILATANVKGLYDLTAKATSVAAANIVNNRAVEVKSINLDVITATSATITVELNRSVDGDVQKSTDLVIGRINYTTFSKANKIEDGSKFTFIIANADALTELNTSGTKVRVVNKDFGDHVTTP